MSQPCCGLTEKVRAGRPGPEKLFPARPSAPEGRVQRRARSAINLSRRTRRWRSSLSARMLCLEIPLELNEVLGERHAISFHLIELLTNQLVEFVCILRLVLHPGEEQS